MPTERKLFRFTRGDVHWRYTSAQGGVVDAGDTYLYAPIDHGRITDGGDRNKAGIEITLPKDLAVADNWAPFPPADPVTVTIWTEVDGTFFVDWIGRVFGPKFNGTTLTLTSEPSLTSARRGGKGRRCQRGCDHILFSDGCGVDPVDHALPATLSAVDNLTLTSAAFLALPAGRLAGGWVEWTRPDGIVERRSIDLHPGDSVVIDYGSEDLVEDLEITAYPGCAQTWEDCEYYENTENYGGFVYRPNRNYYDGNPVR